MIPEHSYRLCLTVGIQPARASILLDAHDAGTPQRFIWLPITDPDFPDVEPPEPEPLDRTSIGSGWEPMGVTEIQLPPEAEQFVRDNRRKVVRGNGSDNKHLTLCRIKVAVALALLHGHRNVTSEFWEMSEEVMKVSEATLAGVRQVLAIRGSSVTVPVARPKVCVRWKRRTSRRSRQPSEWPTAFWGLR